MPETDSRPPEDTKEKVMSDEQLAILRDQFYCISQFGERIQTIGEVLTGDLAKRELGMAPPLKDTRPLLIAVGRLAELSHMCQDEIEGVITDLLKGLPDEERWVASADPAAGF